MDQNPSISIIMPVYNTEENYLKKAIDSVLNQSFEDFEFIIVNDGSTNNVEDIILSYDDRRIKYIVQTNGGQSKARNTAIRRAKGKYIFYIDADDWIETDTLEKCYSKAEGLNLDILLFGSYAHNIKTKETKDWSPELHSFIDEHNILSCQSPEIHECLFVMNPACWGKLFKTDFWIKNEIFFEEGLIFEDFDVLFRYMLKASRIGVIKEMLYHYNLDVENSTTETGNEKYFDLLKIFNLVENTLNQNNLFERQKINFYNTKNILYSYWYNKIRPELKNEFMQLITEDLKKSKLKKRELNKLTCKNEFYKILSEFI